MSLDSLTTGHFDGGANLNEGSRTSPDALILTEKINEVVTQVNTHTLVLAGAVDPKDSCDYATAAALPACTAAGAGSGKTLTANANGALTVDGTAVSVGQRILVKNQVAGKDNGIYVVTAAGAAGAKWILTRATDADTDAEVTSGMWTQVVGGTDNLKSKWMLTTVNPIVVDTTALVFEERPPIEHASEHIKGGGDELDGDKLNVDMTPSNYTPDATVPEAGDVDHLAAHLGGIDNALSGYGIKRTVRLATDGALAAYTAAGSGVGKTLTANAVGVENIDGVAVNLDDRIFVNNDGTATAADRGIYTVTTVGDGANAQVLTRAVDFDQDAEVISQVEVNVSEGTANGNSKYVLITDAPIVVDTTALSFERRGVYALVGDITNVDAADIADAGTADTYARGDHEHGVSTAAPGATGVATAAAEGTATTLARSDHAHISNTAPSDVTKAAAAIGTSGEPARADHKHDVSTAIVGAIQIGDPAAEGTATSLARSDHTHSLAAPAAPENVAGAAATGSGTTAAREDHAHKLASVVTFLARQGKATGAGNAAALGTRNAHTTVDFDDGGATVDEQIAFEGVVPPHYSGGDLTVVLGWVSASAVAGDVKWDVSAEKMEVGTLDIDADSYAAAKTQTTTCSGTSGIIVETTFTFTQAEADGIAAGDPFRLLVMRDSNDAADDMVGDAQLLYVRVTQ